MKRCYSRRVTMHDSMPWSDESWYYDDDFYNDGVLRNIGKAIGIVKKTPMEKAIGAIKGAGKRISKTAKSAGKWVKNNPGKTAAIAGAGIGAGVAANQAARGFMGDAVPWDAWYDAHYLDLLSPNEIASFALRGNKLAASAAKNAKAGVSSLRKAAASKKESIAKRAASMAKHEAASAVRGNAMQKINQAKNPSLWTRAKNKISAGIEKAGNAIERGSNKITNALFKKNPAKEVKKAAPAAEKASGTLGEKVGSAINKAGEWVKNNPGKTAAIAGAAGVGAGALAHKAASSRDSMFGMTAYDSLPWVNKRRHDSALKRYIDKRVKQIVSRLNDIDPGEFDPSIPLYNNRLPKPAETNVTRAPGRPVSTTLAEITSSVNEIKGAISFLAKNGIPVRMKEIFDKACPEMITLARDGSSVMLRRALKINALLIKYIDDIKSRFLFDNGSHSSMYKGDPLQAKQLLNKCTEKLKKLDSLLTSFSLR